MLNPKVFPGYNGNGRTIGQMSIGIQSERNYASPFKELVNPSSSADIEQVREVEKPFILP
jgi:hypothetical protein